MSEPDPDTYEKRWKDHVKQLERLRIGATGEDFDRLGEIQDELNEIIESVADEQREE